MSHTHLKLPHDNTTHKTEHNDQQSRSCFSCRNLVACQDVQPVKRQQEAKEHPQRNQLDNLVLDKFDCCKVPEEHDHQNTGAQHPFVKAVLPHDKETRDEQEDAVDVIDANEGLEAEPVQIDVSKPNIGADCIEHSLRVVAHGTERLVTKKHQEGHGESANDRGRNVFCETGSRMGDSVHKHARHPIPKEKNESNQVVVIFPKNSSKREQAIPECQNQVLQQCSYDILLGARRNLFPLAKRCEV
mmetsp:Transcript_24575/g.58030  ORF Transcript_24575/g.58030 Transcript_24575/m.58030 type:complete len:244 (+) Transcript_24575:117-848(+)